MFLLYRFVKINFCQGIPFSSQTTFCEYLIDPLWSIGNRYNFVYKFITVLWSGNVKSFWEPKSQAVPETVSNSQDFSLLKDF